MAEICYTLCTLTSFLSAWLLVRAYLRGKTTILFWSALSFGGMAINNVFLFLDLVVFPTGIDLAPARAMSALLAVSFLLFGFVWGQAK